MTDSRGERARKFAEMHSSARLSKGKSQEFMALQLKVSTNTVKNWEKGVSSPDFFESLKWFEVLNINPLPYYLAQISPYKTSILKNVDDSNKIMEAFHALNDELPTATKEAILYLFKGIHEGSRTTVVQLLLAYLHLPLKTRIIPAMSIALRYDIDKEMDALICKNDILPNMEELSVSIERAYLSSMNGEYGYTIVKRNSDELSCVDEDGERMKFAEIHLKARTLSGMSQEDMAMELGVTKNTVKNWEKGVSMPSFFQSLEWFRALNMNPFPYYLPLISLFREENEVSEGKEESVHMEFRELGEKLTLDEKRAILYLFYGKHGSSPFAVVQLFLAYFHSTIKNRIISGVTIAHMYRLENELGNIICKEDMLPDKVLMEEAIRDGRANAIREEGHTVIDKGVDPKTLQNIAESIAEHELEEMQDSIS